MSASIKRVAKSTVSTADMGEAPVSTEVKTASKPAVVPASLFEAAAVSNGPNLNPPQSHLSKWLYGAKARFWGEVAALVPNVPPVKLVAPEDKPLKMGTIGDQIPGTSGIDVAYPVELPKSDNWPEKNAFFGLIRFLNRFMSLRQKDLPTAEFGSVAGSKLTRLFEERGVAAPKIPAALLENPLNAVDYLALQGPFAAYIEKTPGTDNGFHIDMSWMAKYPVQNGNAPLGVRIDYQKQGDAMVAESITYQGRVFTKDSPEWELVHRAALATMTTAMVAGRHLGQVHMIMGGMMTGLNSHLPAEHPVRRLMHPHGIATLGANMEISNLIESEVSTFPQIFSFDSKTIKQLINDQIQQFDIASMDPAVSAQKRGLADIKAYPYRENATALHGMIAKYVSEFIDIHYASEESVQNDEALKSWFAEADQLVPNGITSYTGAYSKEAVQKLVTAYIYNGTVEHENVGNVTYDITTDQTVVPGKVMTSGDHVNIGDQARFQNVNVVTFGDLHKLTSLPEIGQRIIGIEAGSQEWAVLHRFVAAMVEYDQALRADPSYEPSTTMYPSKLEISIQS